MIPVQEFKDKAEYRSTFKMVSSIQVMDKTRLYWLHRYSNGDEFRYRRTDTQRRPVNIGSGRILFLIEGSKEFKDAVKWVKQARKIKQAIG